MPTVEIHGVETSYQSIGKHEPTLLLLHGWGNDWQAWSPLIPLLSQKYRLVIPDLPGFGRSSSPTLGWSTPQYVEWLEQFLKALDIKELEAVLGHSFGGKVAAFGWFQKNNSLPLPRQGLCLISPSGIPSRLSKSKKILASVLPWIPLFLRRSLLGSFRTFFYKTLLEENDYLEASPFQEKTLHRILREDVREATQQSSLPLHLCWGENDSAVPLWMAYKYRSLSERSSVFVVPHTGHFAHQTRTDLVFRWIEANL